MNLVLGDVESESLDTAATALSDAGYDVAAMQLDVTDLDGIRAFKAFARESFGATHVLCDNAVSEPEVPCPTRATSTCGSGRSTSTCGE